MRASNHHYHLLQVSLVAVNSASTSSTNHEGMMWDVAEQGVQCVEIHQFLSKILYFYVHMILSIHI